MKLTFILVLLISLASCNRHVIKSRSVEAMTVQKAVSSIDTSCITLTQKTIQTLTYGDTLTGSLYYPLTDFSAVNQNQQLSDSTGVMPVVEDSLESNGLKIKVGILPYKGGFKTHIIATSKPVNVVNTTETNQQVKVGKTSTDSSTAQTNLDTSNNETHTDSFGYMVVVALFLVIAFLIIKEIYNGKKDSI